MLENPQEVQKLVRTLHELFRLKQSEIAQYLIPSKVIAKQTDYDNWDGGTFVYTLYISVRAFQYQEMGDQRTVYEKEITSEANLLLRGQDNNMVGNAVFTLLLDETLDISGWFGIVTKEDVISEIETAKELLISAATGTQINEINQEYINSQNRISEWYQLIGSESPFAFKNLWEWYKLWKKKDLTTYLSRKEYINRITDDAIDLLKKADYSPLIDQPTGWQRVDRSLNQIQEQFHNASTEEQFQEIGLLIRETYISLAQMVFDPVKHDPIDGITPSETDAKRMLDAYIVSNLSGKSNEVLRKFVRSAVALAEELTHKRTATKRDANLCIVAVSSIIKIIKVLNSDLDDV